MKRIKVLPVYPKFPLTFWSFKSSIEYLGKKATVPPTGLATVLAMLPEDKFEVERIIDLNVEPLRDWDLKNTDLVFTSTMIVQENSHNQVVERAHHFGKKVVAGGPFLTTYPEKTNADYIVTGEAEVTLRPFLEDLLNGRNKRIWTEEEMRGKGTVQLTRGGKVEITSTPLPRWDLLNLKNYASVAIQYSRGCPFDCDFCDITKLFGRESRTKTPQQMEGELNSLYDSGHRGSVFIVDDNFIGNAKNVRSLLPILRNWQEKKKFPFSFYTEASMNLAWPSNSDILIGMKEAGFDFVFLGIESIDNEVLKKMNKGQNTKMSQLDAVRIIQNAGLEVSGGFIIGSDGEKPDVFKNLFNFIQRAGIPLAMPGLLTVVRGTDLYKRLQTEGRIREESSGNNTHDLRFNYDTQLPSDFLLNGYKELIENLFDPRNYYQRCRVLRDNLGKKTESREIKRQEINALLRSLSKQLFSKGGLEYAKYLADTLIHKPRYFSVAVSHGIKHDHLYKITSETLEADHYKSHTSRLYESFVKRAEDIYNNHSDDLSSAGMKLSDFAYKTLNRAEKKLSKLHIDFRSGAQNAFQSLKDRIKQDLDSYLSGRYKLAQ